MLQTALIFGDNMVLQRGKKIPVWGTATPHGEVTVSIQGVSGNAAADADGAFCVLLPPLETSFDETMTIAAGDESLTFTGVMVGEVWLAGGQSNMEFHMRYDADVAAEKEKCAGRNIRFFDYPEVSYPEQIHEADYSKEYGFWRKPEPEQLERFSAVGWYFASELENKYKIPVGIIGCNWGGTPACAWMPEQDLIDGGGQVFLDEYKEAISKLDLEEYDRNFRNNPGSYRTDQLADPIGDKLLFGCTMEEFMGMLAQMGIDVSSLDPSAFLPVMGPKYERRPCGLYESMLKPLAPYGIRGVIWYQGETDGDTHPELYHLVFPAMIKSWRKLWGEELPFLFTQIAGLDHWMECVGEPYAKIRDAQQYTEDTVLGTGMAVTSDVGMQFDIHPKKKQPVGRRLALLAENKVYGDDVLCKAPTLLEAAISDGRAVLTFANAGDGLTLKETVPYGQVIGKETPGGLQIIQDGEELPADSFRAYASGDTMTVESPAIKAGRATVVRMAKTGWYLVNLYNSNDIPARPAAVAGH